MTCKIARVPMKIDLTFASKCVILYYNNYKGASLTRGIIMTRNRMRIGEVDSREEMNLDELLVVSNVFSVGVSKRARVKGTTIHSDSYYGDWRCMQYSYGGNAHPKGISPYHDQKFTKSGVKSLRKRVVDFKRSPMEDVLGWKLHVVFADKTGKYKNAPAGSIKLTYDTKSELLADMRKVLESGTFGNKKFPYDTKLYDVRRTGVKMTATSPSTEGINKDGTVTKMDVNFWTRSEMEEFDRRHKQYQAERDAENERIAAMVTDEHRRVSRRTGISPERLAEAEDARMAHYGPIAQGSMLAGTS